MHRRRWKARSRTFRERQGAPAVAPRARQAGRGHPQGPARLLPLIAAHEIEGRVQPSQRGRVPSGGPMPWSPRGGKSNDGSRARGKTIDMATNSGSVRHGARSVAAHGHGTDAHVETSAAPRLRARASRRQARADETRRFEAATRLRDFSSRRTLRRTRCGGSCGLGPTASSGRSSPRTCRSEAIARTRARCRD